MSPARVLSLQEARRAPDIQLSTAEARRLVDGGIAEVRPGREPGQWDVFPRHIAGVVRVGALTVEIKPKVPVARLLWLLEHGWSGADWSPEPATLDEDVSLTDAVADLFLNAVERLLRTVGLTRGYVPVAETVWTLRGRLRMADQMTRHQSQPLPVEVSYDDFSLDTAEHRLLLAALHVVAGHSWAQLSVSARARRQAQRAAALAQAFDGVVPRFLDRDRGGHDRDSLDMARLPRSYAVPVALAMLILDGGSLDLQHGRAQGHGLLLDMPLVFEQFVAGVLTRRLPSAVVSQSARPYAWDQGRPSRRIRPDLVLHDTRGAPRVVLDTKYKSAGEPGIADMYQMHVYARMLGVQNAVLLYAEPTPPRSWLLDPEAGIRVHARGVDLSSAPAKVIDDVVAAAVVE